MVFTPFCSTCFSLSNDGPYIMVRAHSCGFLSRIFQYFAFFSTVWTVFGKPKTDSCSWVHLASDDTIFKNCQNFHFKSISFCGLDPQIFCIVANFSTHPRAPPILSIVVHSPINDLPILSTVVHDPINDPPILSIVVHGPINDPPIMSIVVHGPINDPPIMSTVVHSPINDSPILSTVVHSPINDPPILSTVVHCPINV